MSGIEDDGTAWSHAAEWLNRTNGYGSGFHYNNVEERTFVEEVIAAEFGDAMRQSYGVRLSTPAMNSSDPPDFWIEYNGRRRGIEIVQFVNSHNLPRARRGESPYSGQLAADAQWTADGFRSALESVLIKKYLRYEHHKIKIDTLLIFSVEPWLTLTMVDIWLRQADLPRSPVFKSAFMMFDYEPGGSNQSWPIRPLYGAHRWCGCRIANPA